jgi:hypothetical protein
VFDVIANKIFFLGKVVALIASSLQ